MISQKIDLLREVETPLNPFPGLRPFEFSESHLYFGRDGQSEQLLKKLSATRFLAVVGTSGSGKSSLVRAGLLPTLYGGFMASAGSNWKVAIMRPGNNPIGNLAQSLNTPEVFGSEIEENARLQTAITEATLRRSNLGLIEAARQNRMPENENLLVVVDQFEEIFRFAQVSDSEQYQNEAAAFVKLLLEASRQRDQAIYVVITLRSDYLGDCALFWDLPEAINEGQYLIPRLTREQRREAITGPVAVGGAEITPRLVTQLLNEMGDNPDQLPILQHALMRTWEEWRREGALGEPLDIRHYEATGGMRQALSRHADEAYNELPNERSREIAEKMFKGLTEKGADNRETRRPIEMHGLCALTQASEAEVKAVIEPFRREGRSFLMPPALVPLHAHSLIDISHESLIRNWDRLKGWVDEEARSARIYRRLADTAVLYEKGEAGLWRDPDLQLALVWREQSRPNKAWAQRYHPAFDEAMRFLDASVAAREAEILSKEQQRRNRVRLLTAVVFILALFLILALAALVYANQQRREAIKQSGRAEALLLQAKAQEEIAKKESAEALRQKNIAEQETAKALASEEKAKENEKQARESEQRAVEAKSEALRQKELAINSERAARESAIQAKKAEMAAHAEARRNAALTYATKVNFAQREAELASQSSDLGNPSRAENLLEEAASDTFKDFRSFEYLYLKRLLHFDLAPLGDFPKQISSVAFSRDGTLASSSYDGYVRLWDDKTFDLRTADFKHPPSFDVKAGPLTALGFSPDGKTLAIGSSKGVVKLLDVTDIVNPQEKKSFSGNGEAIRAVSFSPDGKLLATSSTDHTIRLFDLTSMEEKESLKGHTGVVLSGAFSPDGILASGGVDQTVKLWDLNRQRELTNPQIKSNAVGCEVHSVAFSRDGRMLATGCEDGAVYLWDLKSGTEPAPQKLVDGTGDPVFSLDFSPDNRTLAIGRGDKTARLWDINLRKELKVFTGYDDAVTSISFAPGGRYIATGSNDGTVRLGYALPQQSVPLSEKTKSTVSVALSENGELLATASYNGDVTLWKIDDRKEIKTFDQAGHQVALSPGGEVLAIGTKGGTVRLWDVVNQKELQPLKGHADEVLTLAFSGKGILATGGGDKTVRLWDVKNSSEIIKLTGYTGAVKALAFSPDGRRLYTGSADSLVMIWDVTNTDPKLLFKQEWKAGPATALAVSPDGTTFATGNTNGAVDLWINQVPVSLTGYGGGALISSLAFTRDGKTLAIGSHDKTVKLWSISARQEVITIKNFKDSNGKDIEAAVLALAFAPKPLNGDFLVTGVAFAPAQLFYADCGNEEDKPNFNQWMLDGTGCEDQSKNK
ncbi:MAG TPA: hypothetical protein VD966_07960 [Pyrinomonadaceae bacterium]|nr:hypothetical protein [Pyrinomonadaceae bacterium]